MKSVKERRCRADVLQRPLPQDEQPSLHGQLQHSRVNSLLWICNMIPYFCFKRWMLFCLRNLSCGFRRQLLCPRTHCCYESFWKPQSNTSRETRCFFSLAKCLDLVMVVISKHQLEQSSNSAWENINIILMCLSDVLLVQEQRPCVSVSTLLYQVNRDKWCIWKL